MLTESINSFFDAMGAEWVLWLLVALSAISITVIVERWLFLVSRQVDIDSLNAHLLEQLSQNRLDKARKIAQAMPGMTGTVLMATMDAHRDNVAEIGEVIAATIARERTHYDRNLTLLGTLGNNAPFIGLFGTVIGIINAFSQLAGAAEGTERTEAVMHSISEALVATAVGLAVAIPAVIAFNSFKTRIRKLCSENEWLARTTLAYLARSNPNEKG